MRKGNYKTMPAFVTDYLRKGAKIRGIDRADHLLYTSEQVVFLGQKKK